MYGKGVYLSVFYCFFHDTDLSRNMLEDLNEEEDIRMDEITDEHWLDISEDGDDKKNIHTLMWEV